MKLNGHLLLLFAYFLAACQPQAQTPGSLSVTPTPAQTSPGPTQTLTSTRQTPSPAPSLSPQDIASSVLTELSIDKTREYSPNGYCQWERLLAWSLSEVTQRKYSSQFFTYVKVTCEQEWVLIEERKEQNLGYSIPEPVGWSMDGKYIYFHDAVIPDGCQPLGGFQQNLRQVELSTGNIRVIPLQWTGGVALSPDSTKLVYYDWENVEVGVYDLVNQEEQRIPFELPEPMEDWHAGDSTWSPDSRAPFS